MTLKAKLFFAVSAVTAFLLTPATAAQKQAVNMTPLSSSFDYLHRLRAVEIKAALRGKWVMPNRNRRQPLFYDERFYPDGRWQSARITDRLLQLSGTWDIKDDQVCVHIGAQPARCRIVSQNTEANVLMMFDLENVLTPQSGQEIFGDRNIELITKNITTYIALSKLFKPLNRIQIRKAVIGKYFIPYLTSEPAIDDYSEQFDRDGTWTGAIGYYGGVEIAGKWSIENDELCTIELKRGAIELDRAKVCRKIWRNTETNDLYIHFVFESKSDAMYLLRIFKARD